MAGLADLFTKQYINRLDALEFEINRRVGTTMYSGARKSNAKGNSLEFSDFRSYTFGDDLRRIDWNSYARTDKLFMKLFMEERQIAVNIFIDTSGSMGAYEDKSLFCRQLAASVAYISLNNTDKVNIYSFANGVKGKKLNIKSKNSFLDTLKFLDEQKCEGETHMEKSFKDCFDIEKGISVIFSDMFSVDGYSQAVKLLKYKRQEIVAVQVLSQAEAEPDLQGALRLIDSETGRYFDMDIDAEKTEQYKKALADYKCELSEFCSKSGVEFRSVSAGDDPLRALIEILKIG